MSGAAFSATGRIGWRQRLQRHRGARAGGAVLLLMAALAILGPLLSPHGADVVNWDAIEQAPSAAYLFGTDSVGRDLFGRLMLATGISLALGLLATVVSVVIGIGWGAVAGLAGGRVDALMMRIVDVLYAMPFLFFVIVLMAVFGRSLWLIFIGVGAVEWLTLARIVRGQTLLLKNQPFAEAARACGAGPLRLLTRHIVPNLLGLVAVYATLTVPQVILVESFLSFLGLGVQEPLTSLGVLVKEGVETLETAPWLILIPSLWLAALLLALNLVGDALRDAFDPKDR
ncbi:ABC transporter permease [Pedomonas sp. V897]|uniref:ABC transporter permease n=1 Tax=Pedomonas sp. V897 TaxID=3446482 RepID=UPI003EE34DB7